MTLKILLRKKAIDKIHSNPTLRQNYISMCLIALIFLSDLSDYRLFLFMMTMMMMMMVILTVS